MADYRLILTAQVDPEQGFFLRLCDVVRKFPDTDFATFASRVETLVEICENISCQRVMDDVEAE